MQEKEQVRKNRFFPISIMTRKQLERVFAEAEEKAEEYIQEERRWLERATGSRDLSSFDDSYVVRASRFREDIEPARFRSHLTKVLGKEKAELVEAFAYNYVGGSGAQFLESPEEVRIYQDGSREKAIVSPHIGAIVDNHKQFVVGNGIRIEIPNQEINQVVAEELERNQFDIAFKEWVEAAFIDGELPIAIYVNEGKFWFVQEDPQDIADIEKHTKDKSLTHSYKLRYRDTAGDFQDTYLADIDYYERQNSQQFERSQHDSELSQNSLMMFVRYGSRRRKRGIPQLLSLLRYDRLYEDLIFDLALLLHERSKVVWILSITGKKVVDRDLRPPKGSTVRVETDYRKWRVENPQLAGHINSEYGRIIRLPLCAKSGFPEYMIFGETRGANYASLRETTHPVVQMTNMYQDFWEYWIKKLIHKILKEKAATGDIARKVRIKKPEIELVAEAILAIANSNGNADVALAEAKQILSEGKVSTEMESWNLPISIIWPSLAPANELIRNQALQVADEQGWISRDTIRKELGYNVEIEKALIALQRNEVSPNGARSPSRSKLPRKTKEQPQTNYDRKVDKAFVPEAENGKEN